MKEAKADFDATPLGRLVALATEQRDALVGVLDAFTLDDLSQFTEKQQSALARAMKAAQQGQHATEAGRLPKVGGL